MIIPSSELRIQICKCIIDFYHAEPPKKHITGKVFNSLSVITYVFIKQNSLSHFSLNLERQSGIINATHRASLVTQWLRIHLPIQGTWVRALIWEDPRSRPQLLSLRSRARKPQLLKPTCLEPMLCNKRSHHNEKPTHCNEE